MISTTTEKTEPRRFNEASGASARWFCANEVKAYDIVKKLCFKEKSYLDNDRSGGFRIFPDGGGDIPKRTRQTYYLAIFLPKTA